MPGSVAHALARPIVFFGGKGGVGKTTLAAAFALRSAASGVRTLLVSTDPAHSTADALGVQLGPEPARVLPLLDALELDAAHEAERYIEGVKARIREVASPRMLAEIEREVDAARLSPGAEEAALFERFAALMQHSGAAWERIVFDTAPTGHTLQLLTLPERMQDWIDALVARRRKVNALARMWRNVAGGVRTPDPADAERTADVDPVLAVLEARQARFRAARVLVTDPARTAFAFVLVPERLPLLETQRAVATLQRYGVPVSALIVNRVVGTDAEGAFAERLRQTQWPHLAAIDAAFPGLPIARVAYRPEEPDRAALEQLAATL